MPDHRMSREEWAAAREELLEREKEHTRLGDELARRRRELPWVRVEQEYRLDTDDGPRTLRELFDGRSQLLVYHFMFGPSYEAGCPTNSSIADAVDGVLPHLHARDATMLLRLGGAARPAAGVPAAHGLEDAVGLGRGQRLQRRPRLLATEEQTREAIAPWIEAGPAADRRAQRRASGTDVTGYLTQTPGFSAFARDDDAVYQTYATTARGLEFLMGYYGILDRAPRGRDEGESFQTWIRRHDEYGK